MCFNVCWLNINVLDSYDWNTRPVVNRSWPLFVCYTLLFDHTNILWILVLFLSIECRKYSVINYDGDGEWYKLDGLGVVVALETNQSRLLNEVDNRIVSVSTNERRLSVRQWWYRRSTVNEWICLIKRLKCWTLSFYEENERFDRQKENNKV